MDKKNFKNREIARLQKEINKLYELKEISEFNETQCERICLLSRKIMELKGKCPFNVKKGWEDFKNNYLPVVENDLQEREMINEIYKNVAKNTGFSEEEVKRLMQEPVNFADFTVEKREFQEMLSQNEKCLTYEEFIIFFIKVLKNK